MPRSPEQAYYEVLTEVPALVPPIFAAAWRAALDEFYEGEPSPEVQQFIGKVEGYAVSLGEKVGDSLATLVVPLDAEDPLDVETEPEGVEPVSLDDIFGEGFSDAVDSVLGTDS